jgi:uncharacterized RDD family membrane protein YckC
MKPCPQCNTKALNSAVKCDCGYLFSENKTAAFFSESSLPAVGQVRTNPPMMSVLSQANFASFGQRVAAFLLDVIIQVIGGFIIVYFWGLAFVANGGTSQEGLQLMSFGLRCVIGWIYFSAMESSPLEGTLGKLALGLKVTDITGSRVSFSQASGRWFGKWVSTLILTIGWWMAAFTPKKQALHDMMAGCVITRR